VGGVFLPAARGSPDPGLASCNLAIAQKLALVGRGGIMVITEDRLLVEVPREAEDLVAPVAVEDRARDAEGHCWDGSICDHPDHGSVGPEYGTIHFMR
jgi:hypothetical protein